MLENENLNKAESPQLNIGAVMRSAYGEYWDKVKEYVNEKGWCLILPDLELTPGGCGMTASSYQVKNLEPNNNYMKWSHFRPNVLKCLD